MIYEVRAVRAKRVKQRVFKKRARQFSSRPFGRRWAALLKLDNFGGWLFSEGSRGVAEMGAGAMPLPQLD